MTRCLIGAHHHSSCSCRYVLTHSPFLAGHQKCIHKRTHSYTHISHLAHGKQVPVRFGGMKRESVYPSNTLQASSVPWTVAFTYEHPSVGGAPLVPSSMSLTQPPIEHPPVGGPALVPSGMILTQSPTEHPPVGGPPLVPSGMILTQSPTEQVSWAHLETRREWE